MKSIKCRGQAEYFRLWSCLELKQGVDNFVGFAVNPPLNL